MITSRLMAIGLKTLLSPLYCSAKFIIFFALMEVFFEELSKTLNALMAVFLLTKVFSSLNFLFDM